MNSVLRCFCSLSFAGCDALSTFFKSSFAAVAGLLCWCPSGFICDDDLVTYWWDIAGCCLTRSSLAGRRYSYSLGGFGWSRWSFSFCPYSSLDSYKTISWTLFSDCLVRSFDDSSIVRFHTKHQADGALNKVLNELIAALKELKIEVQAQVGLLFFCSIGGHSIIDWFFFKYSNSETRN